MRDMNSVAPAEAINPASANSQKSKGTTQAVPTSLTNGEPNYIFKIVIIGDTSVGKSSLLRSYISGEFDEKQTHTIGVEFASRVIDVEGENVKLQLWDTAGQERFKAMTKSYYRGAAGCILVYDITRRETFLNIRNWVQEFRNHSGSPDAVMMVVGNKCDVVEARQVQFEEGVEFAKEFGIVFCEASAKNGENLADAFETTAQKIYEKVKEGQLDVSNAEIGAKKQIDLNSRTVSVSSLKTNTACCGS